MAGLFARGWRSRRMSWQGRLLLAVGALLPWAGLAVPESHLSVVVISAISIVFAGLFFYSFRRLRRSLVSGVVAGAITFGGLYASGWTAWFLLFLVGYLAMTAVFCDDSQGIFP